MLFEADVIVVFNEAAGCWTGDTVWLICWPAVAFGEEVILSSTTDDDSPLESFASGQPTMLHDKGMFL